MESLADHNYLEFRPEALIVRKKELFLVLDTHQSQDFFNCTASTIETYNCNVCGFETNMRILAHKTCPKSQLTDSPLTKDFSISYTCKKCNFETFSCLVYIRHVYVKCPMKMKRMWYECDQYNYIHRQANSLVKSVLTQTNRVTTDKLYNSYDEHNYCKRISQPPQEFETVYVTEEHNNLIIKECFSKRKKIKRTIKNAKKSSELDWYYCDKCKYRTITVCSLRKHIAESHSKKKVTKKSTKSKKNICATKCRANLPKRYLVESTGGFGCLYCPFKTPEDQILINHILTEHSKPGKVKDCLYCPFKTVRDQILIDHILKNHLKHVQLRACKHCRFTTSNSAILKQHFQENHIWICPYCSDRPTSALALSEHITTNHRPIRCNFCQYSTQYRYELMQHLEDFHSSQCLCSSCGFVAETEMALSEHLATIHQLTKCVHCNFSSRDDEELDEHLRQMHVKCPDVALDDDVLANQAIDEQASKCASCLFVAESQTALAKHRVHKCDYCSYSSCANDVLRKHVSKGHYRCLKCPFECDSKVILSRHVMAHHKVKWYSCEGCSFKDRFKANIEEHIMKEHTNANEALKCGLCPFKTGKRIDLDMHLFQKHGKHL